MTIVSQYCWTLTDATAFLEEWIPYQHRHPAQLPARWHGRAVRIRQDANAHGVWCYVVLHD